jgi:hypothetical protein
MNVAHWLNRATRLLGPSAYLVASLLFAALMAWAILGSSVIDPQNVKWMREIRPELPGMGFLSDGEGLDIAARLCVEAEFSGWHADRLHRLDADRPGWR